MADCELCGDERATNFHQKTDFGTRHVCDGCHGSLAKLPVETSEEKVARIRFEMDQPNWEESRIDVAALNFLTLLGYTEEQIFGSGKPNPR